MYVGGAGWHLRVLDRNPIGNQTSSYIVSRDFSHQVVLERSARTTARPQGRSKARLRRRRAPEGRCRPRRGAGHPGPAPLLVRLRSRVPGRPPSGTVPPTRVVAVCVLEQHSPRRRAVPIRRIDRPAGRRNARDSLDLSSSSFGRNRAKHIQTVRWPLAPYRRWRRQAPAFQSEQHPSHTGVES